VVHSPKQFMAQMTLTPLSQSDLHWTVQLSEQVGIAERVQSVLQTGTSLVAHAVL
jgi:hypothetical protein